MRRTTRNVMILAALCSIAAYFVPWAGLVAAMIGLVEIITEAYENYLDTPCTCIRTEYMAETVVLTLRDHKTGKSFFRWLWSCDWSGK